MPTDIEQLQTARDGLLQALADAYANPKPTYSKGDQSISWNEYRKSLLDELQSIQEVLQILDPFEIRSQHLG